MTNLIMVAIPFIAGLAIGGGVVMMWINQRKIPLDPYTDQYKINGDHLAKGDNLHPIGIIDAEYGDMEICQITMIGEDQHESGESCHMG